MVNPADENKERVISKLTLQELLLDCASVANRLYPIRP